MAWTAGMGPRKVDGVALEVGMIPNGLLLMTQMVEMSESCGVLVWKTGISTVLNGLRN